MSKVKTVRAHKRVLSRSAVEAAKTAQLNEERKYGFRKPRIRIKAGSHRALAAGIGRD